MTEVGHFLTGATIGVLSMPKSADKKHRTAHIAAFLFLAVIPDLPFKGGVMTVTTSVTACLSRCF